MHALIIESADGLDIDACLRVVDGGRLELGEDLLRRLRDQRRAMLTRLETGDAVYGVTTGMGAASVIRLDADAQSKQQETLMLARSIGSAPWLSARESRAALVVRLRTFLPGDAGVSAELCEHLVDLLNLGLHPAIPATRLGAAGEIIPLAHLGAAITGSGEFLSEGSGVTAAPEALVGAGLTPFVLGPKEGVALIEGVPVTTGLALLRARDARILASQVTIAIAAEIVLVGASRDPYRAEVARGDEEQAEVLAAIRRLAGAEGAATALQAPLSFRVVGPAIAHVLRAASAVDRAAERALSGVTDSPAFVGGRFVGTAGFDGFDLAAHLDALAVATIHIAEVSAARLHRMLDDRVTGLPRQLSDRPGLHAGMVTVHKRAVGVVHELVRRAHPVSLGVIETSLGQEDVQSFSVEAAMAAGAALEGARDVLACELLAIVQARRLAASRAPTAAPSSSAAPSDSWIYRIDAVVAPGTGDRPFGRDVVAILNLLSAGWGSGI